MANIYTAEQIEVTGSASQLVYTCPPNTAAIITGATIANTAAVARLVDADIVRGGGTPAIADSVIIKQPVQLEDDIFLDKLIGKHLNSGDEVYINLDAAGSCVAILDVREIVG